MHNNDRSVCKTKFRKSKYDDHAKERHIMPRDPSKQLLERNCLTYIELNPLFVFQLCVVSMLGNW